MINIVVLLLSATNKETLYEQLVQSAGVETSPISLVSR